MEDRMFIFYDLQFANLKSVLSDRAQYVSCHNRP